MIVFLLYYKLLGKPQCFGVLLAKSLTLSAKRNLQLKALALRLLYYEVKMLARTFFQSVNFIMMWVALSHINKIISIIHIFQL